MSLLIAVACALSASAVVHAADAPHVYEMRTYYVAPGKLEALHKRFRDHTLQLFKKHKIESIGYFEPIDNKENKMLFLLRYPSREAREQSWKAFSADPQWQDAYKKSEANGPLVTNAVSEFFVETDYSPELKIAKSGEPRVFELRTYTAAPGKLENLHSRFRDHTVGLFKKHGMENLVYLSPMSDQKGADNKLVYFLGHKSDEARKESFGKFREDNAWNTARAASERDGSLTARNGVKSETLKAMDYSPLK